MIVLFFYLIKLGFKGGEWITEIRDHSVTGVLHLLTEINISYWFSHTVTVGNHHLPSPAWGSIFCCEAPSLCGPGLAHTVHQLSHHQPGEQITFCHTEDCTTDQLQARWGAVGSQDSDDGTYGRGFGLCVVILWSFHGRCYSFKMCVFVHADTHAHAKTYIHRCTHPFYKCMFILLYAFLLYIYTFCIFVSLSQHVYKLKNSENTTWCRCVV